MFEIWYYYNSNPKIAHRFYEDYPFHNFESAKAEIEIIKNHPSFKQYNDNRTFIILDKNTDRFINVR